MLQVLLLEGVHAGGSRGAGSKVGGRAPSGAAQVAAASQHLHRLLAQRDLLRVTDDLLQPHLPHVLLHMSAHVTTIPYLSRPETISIETQLLLQVLLNIAAYEVTWAFKNTSPQAYRTGGA